MKTRDKILLTAQNLFNQKGIGNVSLRNICEALEISPGNFTYHFPNKDKMIIELYHKMIDELEEAEEHVEAPKKSILFFLQSHKYIFYIQNKYKFFYLNTFELLNNFSDIKKAYLKHILRERKSIEELFESYIRNGIFKKSMKIDLAKKLIRVGQMVNISWITDAEINFKGSEKIKLNYYLQLCCSIIEPYLTPSALEEYEKFFQQHKV